MKNEDLKNIVAYNIMGFWANTDIELTDILINVIYHRDVLELKIFDKNDIDSSFTLTISKVIKPDGMINYCNLSCGEFTQVVNKYGLTEDNETINSKA